MPSARGESSVGKALTKGYVPFRADDLQRGRKTGRHIKSVSRDSGGFEIFDQMMVQAYTDGRKPKPVVKYKVKPVLYDENNQDLYEPEEGSDDEPNEFDQPRVSHDEENEKLYGLGGVDDLVPERASLDEEVFNFPAGEGDGEEVEIEPIPHEPEQTIRPKRQKKEVRQLVDFSDDSEATGLRRSKRRRYAPLEYWRQERVVWGRRENGRSVVPVIKEIITIPKPEPEPLGTKKRRRGARKLRSKSLPSSPPRVKEEIRIVEVDNPELGWDDATPSTGVIIDWTSKEEVERRVAYPAHMVDPKPAQGCDYFFHKIFGDGDFIAAGQLVIPPGAEKPTKPTKDNTYIFYVMQGAIECKVHRTSFVLATGGTFMVPRGNQYYIKNISSRDVKLFFAQARKVPANEVAAPSIIRPRASTAPRAQTPE